MYAIKLHNNINEAAFWKQNFSSSIFEKHFFLQSTVKSNPDINYVFAEVLLRNELVGKLLIQILPFNGSELKTYISDESPCIVKATIDTVLDKINWKLAVIGNLFVSGDNGQFWHKNLSEIERWKILKQLGKQLKKEEKVDTILLTEIMETELSVKYLGWPMWQKPIGHGALYLQIMITMVIKIYLSLTDTKGM